MKKVKNVFIKNKTIFIITGLTIVSIIIYVIFFSNMVLALSKYGSRGNEVTQIQTKLKRWGYLKGNVDGIYGTKTVEAIKYFQRKNGLTIDGIAGKNTLEAMGIYSSSTSGGTSGGSNSNDLNLLARLIHGEARGESYTGQVAVGAVVLNRVKNSSFPNTISGVIYQSGSFDVVSDGQINLAPDDTAKKAAQDAMNRMGSKLWSNILF